MVVVVTEGVEEREGRNGELVFSGDRVSVWDDGKV